MSDREMWTRLRAAAGREEPRLRLALEALRAEVAALATRPPVAVTDKGLLPHCPTDDPHDYVSLGTYWWPNPGSPGGLPYVRRDGYANPEGDRYDRPRWAQCVREVSRAARAAYLLGDAAAASAAACRLRRWFLDPDSRMNPHLCYAQMIPGHCAGRGIGIIDFAVSLPGLLEAVALLAESRPSPLAPPEGEGLCTWCADFLTWLQTHEYGLAERAERNNHGTWYDLLVVSLALHVGEAGLAREVLAGVRGRLAAQVEPDGTMPLELARTRSLSYTVMNTRGFLALAAHGRRQGVELWAWQSADGRALPAAVDFLYGHACSTEEWPREQITPVDWRAVAQLFTAADSLEPGRYPLGALAHRLPTALDPDLLALGG